MNKIAPIHTTPEESCRRALVLGAGAAYGAFQVGVLDYLLRDAQAGFSVITGASVGALNAAILAQGRDIGEVRSTYLPELEELWNNIRGSSDLLGRAWARGRLSSVFGLLLNAPCTLEPLQNLLEERLSIRRLRESCVELAIEVACLDTGRIATIQPSDPNFTRFLLAGCRMPMFFPPAEIPAYLLPDGCCESAGLSVNARRDLVGLPFPSRASLERRLTNEVLYGPLDQQERKDLAERLWQSAERVPDLQWCDAYVRRILPLTPALKRRPDRVVAVHALPTTLAQTDSQDYRGFVPRMQRATGILCREISRTNSTTARILNQVLERWRSVEREVDDDAPVRETQAWRDMADFLSKYHCAEAIIEISPEPGELHSDPLEFSPDVIKKLERHGRQRAEETMG